MRVRMYLSAVNCMAKYRPASRITVVGQRKKLDENFTTIRR
jgi:hypothetical protein